MLTGAETGPVSFTATAGPRVRLVGARRDE